MITFAHVRAALDLPGFDVRAAQSPMMPIKRGVQPQHAGQPPRQSAVLIVIYPEVGDGLHIILTRRADSLRGHSGQVSFPGGKRDPEDRDFQQTALRETCEELGICQRPKVVGKMGMTYIPPSHFDVHPFVATLTSPPQITPNPHEVAHVFTMSLAQLLDPATKDDEMRIFQGEELRVPYYWVQGHKVWGATAIMLSELEHRLRAVI